MNNPVSVLYDYVVRTVADAPLSEQLHVFEALYHCVGDEDLKRQVHHHYHKLRELRHSHNQLQLDFMERKAPR